MLAKGYHHHDTYILSSSEESMLTPNHHRSETHHAVLYCACADMVPLFAAICEEQQTEVRSTEPRSANREHVTRKKSDEELRTAKCEVYHEESLAGNREVRSARYVFRRKGGRTTEKCGVRTAKCEARSANY